MLHPTAFILSLVAGIFFLAAGLLKIFGNQLAFWKWAKASYLVHYPVWVYYASGIIETGAGSGLLLTPSRFYSALSLMAMIVLLNIRPRKPGEKLSAVWTSLVSLLILGFIAYMG